MPDTPETGGATTPPPAPTTPPAPGDAATPDMAQMFARMFADAGITQQMRDGYVELARQQIEMAREQARLEAQREIAEFQARQQLMAFAQHVTTATLQRRQSLALTPDQVVSLLGDTPAPVRERWRQFMADVVEGRAVIAAEPVGADGEGREGTDPAEAFDAQVQAYAAQGMSRSAAIEAVRRNHPAIYTAYNNAGRRRGGR